MTRQPQIGALNIYLKLLTKMGKKVETISVGQKAFCRFDRSSSMNSMKIILFIIAVLNFISLRQLEAHEDQGEAPPPLYAILLEANVKCYDTPSPSGQFVMALSIADIFPLAHSQNPWPEEEWIHIIVNSHNSDQSCFVHSDLVSPFDPYAPELAVVSLGQYVMDREDISIENVAEVYSVLFEQNSHKDWQNIELDVDVPEITLIKSQMREYLDHHSQTNHDLEASDGPMGLIAGTIIDEDLAITLPGVAVEVLDTGQITYTDLDGHYRFELPVGVYKIRTVMGGYAEQTVSVEVVMGQLSSVQIVLSSNNFSEDVVVMATLTEANTSTTAAQMEMRKNAPVLQNNIGADEMTSNHDSDVSDAIRRVTGASVVDGQSVFVRGLGERYSNTTLAGITLPTTKPDRRIVSLDLFPTGLIDSVQISKTYTPDKSPQFAGGLTDILPKKLPNETSYEFSLSGAYNTLTTGRTGPSYDGGRRWSGFDDGTRALPAGFPDRKVIRGGRFTSDELGFLQNDLERLGESFNNVWDPVPRQWPMDQSYSGSFGGRFGKLGAVATVLHSQSSQITNEQQTFYKVGQGGNIELFNGPYYFDETQFTSRVGGIGNATYQFTPNHRLSIDNFFTHIGTDETRKFEGFNSDADNDIRNQRLFFAEEQIRSHFVSSDHLFPSILNSRFDWKVAFTQANRAEPDLREVLYEFDPAREAFVLADESQSGLRQFNDLEDNSVEINANWSILMQNWAQLPTQIKFGAGHIDRTRDFFSRRLRFIPTNVGKLDLSRPAESLFTHDYIGPNFQLKEETRSTDRYDGTQKIASAYGMVDLPLSSQLRLVTGARIENFRQQVDTFDPFARSTFEDDLDIIRADLNETDIFPAVNLVYSVRPNQNLRFALSQTVNRPEFRELAPFEFTDVIGGRAMIGNPDLKQSLIQNVDIRWELFPGLGEEVVAASLFYKKFDNPIERIVEPTAQLRTSFTNAASARNVGFEIEGRKSINKYLLVGANYTYVDSEVALSASSRQIQTSLIRPLAGTSRNLFNTMFEVRNAQRDYSGRLLWNFYGDRISDIGSLGLPDIVQKGRGNLDFVFSKRLGKKVGLKFGITNLSDGAYTFSQGGEDQRVYKLGRTIEFGMSIRP